MLPRAGSQPSRAAHRLALGLVALLAWLALQAGFVFVELIWRAATARADFGALVVAHASQFRTLRRLQGLAWVVTAALFLAWFGRAHGSFRSLRARDLASPSPAAAAASAPRQAAWRWALLLAAVTADLVARGLTMRTESALDLGHAMLILMCGQVLAIAAAAVAIAMVLTVDARHEAPAAQAPLAPPSEI